MKQRLNENNERKESELLVFIKAKDLSAYILLVSGKSPVKFRYSLLNPLINNSLEIIETLYEANELELKDERRLELIRKAKAKIKTIDFLSSIATDASCFTAHQHDVILEKIGVCSKYLQGYYNSCKKALNVNSNIVVGGIDMDIKVIQGDITKLGSEIDCIVNAANETLMGGGGVDGAIHKAAGHGLNDECRELHGCKTGDAKATKAYRLKQKYIIHAVGPDYRFDKNSADKLRSAYRRSLEVADSLGCETIAFPSISTGVFEYPLNEAAKICAETVLAFEGKNLKQAYMVILSGQDRIDAYAKAFAEEEAKRSK